MWCSRHMAGVWDLAWKGVKLDQAAYALLVMRFAHTCDDWALLGKRLRGQGEG